MQRSTADVDWVVDHRSPILKQVTANAPSEASAKHQERQTVMDSHRFIQFVNGKGGVGVYVSVTVVMNTPRGRDQVGRIVEFRNQSINRCAGFHRVDWYFSFLP